MRTSRETDSEFRLGSGKSCELCAQTKGGWSLMSTRQRLDEGERIVEHAEFPLVTSHDHVQIKASIS